MKRTLFKLGLLLLLGAIINVAVALLCARYSGRDANFVLRGPPSPKEVEFFSKNLPADLSTRTQPKGNLGSGMWLQFGLRATLFHGNEIDCVKFEAGWPMASFMGVQWHAGVSVRNDLNQSLIRLNPR